MKKSPLIILILLFFTLQISAQVQEEGTPLTLKKSGFELNNIPEFKLPDFDIEDFREQSMAENKKKLRFAKMFDVNIDVIESASLSETEDGELYLFSVSSEEAFSVQLIFDSFKIPKGSRLFVYNEDYSHIIGALTSKNNKTTNILPVSPVLGEKIIIEYFEPYDAEFSGQLKIGEVGHDFLNIYSILTKGTTGLGDAAECNVNINCPEGQDWQDVKRAVTRLIAGGFLCTGTLINNVNFDRRPYLFTANHCIDNSEDAEEAVVNFNFESPECDTTYFDMTELQSLSGAKLISTAPDNKLDYTLIELSTKVPYEYNPFFAGWSLDTSNITNTACIHHPMGDVMKITKDDDPPVAANYGDTYDDNTHWRVKEWNLGTTEGGSSGSALFNQDQQIIGDLTGGQASCDFNYNDFYAKFNISWDDFGQPEYQLKSWLDPINAGYQSIEGYNPYYSLPSNLIVINQQTQVTLRWNSVTDPSNVSFYEIFRNNVKVGESNQTSYTENLPVADSVYFYKVRGYKTSGNYTVFSDSTGIVPIQPYSLSYNYSFENPGSFESGWFEHSSSSLWSIQSGGTTNPSGASDGSYNAAFNGSAGDTSKLITPKFDFGNEKYVILNFDLAMPDDQFTTDELNIYVRQNDSVPFHKIKTFNSSMDNWQTKSIYLPGSSGSYRIAFEAIGAGGDGIYLDDIQIFADPDAVQPQYSVTKSAICNQDTVIISLDTADVFNSYEWDMGYGAKPRYVQGYGPHEVVYTYPGEKTVSLVTNSRYERVHPGFVNVYEIPQPFIKIENDTLFSNYEQGNHWYINKDTIPGANAAFYVPNQPGVYSVSVTNEQGCSNFSNEITIGDLSITNPELQGKSFEVSPNPSRNVITLSFSSEWTAVQPESYRMYNMSGTLVKQGVLNKDENQVISIEKLTAGIYFIVVKDSSNKLYSRKFIKE